MTARSTSRAEQAALGALAVTCLLTVAKVAVWLVTGSLAVLSQAVDSGLDIVALGLVFFGVRIAHKPADEAHHYGHAKAENIVAFAQTIFLGVVVAAIVFEAIVRLTGDRGEVDAPAYALGLFAVSAVVDVFRVAYLTRVARSESSDALRAGALNLATDVGTALVALLSLALVRAGFRSADALGGLVVAAAVAWVAIGLGRRSVNILMDRAPEASLGAIQQAASHAQGVAETRRVRLRESGNRVFADVTVAAGRTASLERAHDIAEEVEREITRVVPGADVVVHVEPISETTGLTERVQAAASRATGVHEVHNVLVHTFQEGARSMLHVTLHAKAAAATSVSDAHELSDRIEAEVERELGSDVRVDSHIEPFEPAALGRDVTGRRDDVVEEVQRLALEEPDVLDCHEVLVTSAAGVLSVVAHVRGRADLPLTRMHDASTRIEKAIHAAIAEAGPVLIHFEPL